MKILHALKFQKTFKRFDKQFWNNITKNKMKKLNLVDFNFMNYWNHFY